MHQPNYQEPGSGNMVLPWVRLHAIKDYLDMLLAVDDFERLRVTFNLVPSLLDQFDLYINGGSDPHLDLSRLPADQLTEGQKATILDSFFGANATHMIEPYERYDNLFRKIKSNAGTPVLPALFSSSEMRDLQVWSNLAWVDPTFRDEAPIKSLLAQGAHFSEEQKHSLLDWQMNLIGRIVPTYRDYLNRGKVDVSFTPYYHPILPLLCDVRSAREANPRIELPRKPFSHPEDARRQIQMAMDKYQEVFDRPMTGMWPSEGSVSQEVADILLDMGIKWIATDEEILYFSQKKAGIDPGRTLMHTVYDYGPGLKMIFRDHALSDRIGFVYSGWDTDRAVGDFVDHLKNLRRLLLDRIDEAVVPIILDGENAWEYFENDGREFLHELYRRLDEDPEIQTVTMTEATTQIKPQPLKSVFAGSWINHNFRIWIGHSEDNAAWDLLSAARQALVDFETENPHFDAERLAAAWRQIYIGEGSDWCWWYGDDHRGADNEQFDAIFRHHLVAVYELLGLDVPLDLLSPIYRAGAGLRAVMPDSLMSAEIDGRLTYFYEWAGAGYFDCLKAGGAMHRVDRHLAKIHFGYDHEYFYIRLDFINRKDLELLKQPVFNLSFFLPEPKAISIAVPGGSGQGKEPGIYQYCVADMMEIAVKRSFLWPGKFGRLGFTVALNDGDEKIEQWPENEPIDVEVPEKDMEMFWPT